MENKFFFFFFGGGKKKEEKRGGGGDNIDINGDFLSTMFVFRSPRWQEWNELDIELWPNLVDGLAGNVINATEATDYPAGNAAAFTVTQGLPIGYHDYDNAHLRI